MFIYVIISKIYFIRRLEKACQYDNNETQYKNLFLDDTKIKYNVYYLHLLNLLHIYDSKVSYIFQKVF